MSLLTGVRILDLSRALAGPYAAMLLGDMGADVVKVEIPGKGDDSRFWGPFWKGISCYFLSINRNKKSIAVDLKSPAGQEIIAKLADESDVLVENFRVGTLEGLGLGYDDLRARNPKLVYCKISGWGEAGPLRDTPALDLAVQAFTGLMMLTGSPNDPPVRLGISTVDISAGLHALSGILGGLYRRSVTGEGSRVSVSLLGSTLSLLTYHAVGYLNAGVVPVRSGSGLSYLAPYQAYRASDGYLLVAVVSQSAWKSLCRLMEIERLIDDPRFCDNKNRAINSGALNEIIEPLFLERTVSEWVDLFSAYFPCCPVNTIAEALAHEQTEAAGVLVGWPYGDEVLRMVGNPIETAGSTGPMNPPPSLGAQTDEVLRGLGYDEAVIADLRRNGTVA